MNTRLIPQNGTKIFWVSFLMLFLELSLIRWIPAYIRLVSYFANIILLGTFLGIGVGALVGKTRPIWLLLFPSVLFCIVFLVQSFHIEINTVSPNLLFFSDLSGQIVRLEPAFLLPILFFFVAGAFMPLGARLGSLFQTLPPLTAYSWDIVGSIAGIAIFSLLSLLTTPAFVWFAVITILWIIIAKRDGTLTLIVGLGMLLLATSIVFGANRGTWSPYYNITVTKLNDVYEVIANTIEHQAVSHWEDREPFYYVPYEIFPKQPYPQVLVIGAGTGADVAIALAQIPPVTHIDAVEIDPVIAALGRALNPDHPFEDPRVTQIIADGRAFLSHTSKRYDLIIYALPDSLLVTGNSANIRLESFLFTVEAFKLAKDHLSDNGLFTLYNYYRKPWLIDKFSKMLETAFGYPPYVFRFGHEYQAAAIIIGPRANTITPERHLNPYRSQYSFPMATDDWPFPYLREAGVPPFYIKFLAVILLVTVITTALAFRVSNVRRFNVRFFFLGAGFLLLETKSLVTFGLLFGTTWTVNSLVFGGILLFILLANLVSVRVVIRPLWLLYVGLFGMLIFSFFLPSSIFLQLTPIPRYIAAITFYFSPIFLANLLFSQLFRSDPHPNVSFGSNMVGAVAGGMLEYLSLAVGYKYLILVVVGCYLFSLIPAKRS